MVQLAAILYLVGNVIIVVNVLLWFFQLSMPYGGAQVRQQYRWARGVPLWGSVCVLVAQGVMSAAGDHDLVLRSALLLIADPHGFLWVTIAHLRQTRA